MESEWKGFSAVVICENEFDALCIDTFLYKGYVGSIEYDKESDQYHGFLIGIRDLVTYQSKTRDGLKREFEDAVEDYIKTREYVNRELLNIIGKVD